MIYRVLGLGIGLGTGLGLGLVTKVLSLGIQVLGLGLEAQVFVNVTELIARKAIMFTRYIRKNIQSRSMISNLG